MSVEELVKRLRSPAHLMQADGLSALLDTGAHAADKLEELAAWNARLDRDLVDWTKKCFDAEAALAEAKRENEEVRDKALDRASEAALAMLINDTDSNPRLAAKVENAIRSLKTGGKDAE